MIPAKSLKVPLVSERVLRITPDFLRTSGRVHRYVPVGLREEEGRFVVAEGSEDIGALSQSAVQLYATRTNLFTRTLANQYLRRSDGMTLGLNFVASAVIDYVDGEGTVQTLFVGETRTMLAGSTTLKNLTAAGTCAAVHHERIFIGKDNTLSYCVPFEPENWDTMSEGAGQLPLPATGGNILALLSFKERLYVFREKELLRLRADANDLNFRIEQVHHDYGKLLVGSLQPCGEKFVYMTARGLVAGDGSSFRCRPWSALSAAPDEPVQAGYADGKYYALVTRADGANCILVYDPEADMHHFLEAGADYLAGAGDELYLGHGTRLCRLTGQGFPVYEFQLGTLCAELDIGTDGGAARRIDGVSVTGKGEFTLALETEEGKCSVTFSGGVRVPLKKVLRGTFLKLELYAQSTDSEVRAINLHFREETP